MIIKYMLYILKVGSKINITILSDILFYNVWISYISQFLNYSYSCHDVMMYDVYLYHD